MTPLRRSSQQHQSKQQSVPQQPPLSPQMPMLLKLIIITFGFYETFSADVNSNDAAGLTDFEGLIHVLDDPSFCLARQLIQPSRRSGGDLPVHLHQCYGITRRHFDAQRWKFDAGSAEIRPASNPRLCLAAPKAERLKNLVVTPCGTTDKVRKTWTYSSDDGLLRLQTFHSLCVSAESLGPPRNFLKMKMKSCEAGTSLRFAGSVVDCGKKSSPLRKLRIMGGMDADEASHPWQVHVRLQARVDSTLRKKTFGGTLVDSDHVVTAAHCVVGDVVDAIVVAGSNFRSRRLDAGRQRPQMRSVKRIEIHRKFKEYRNPAVALGSVNDIAILTLSSPLDLSRGSAGGVIPICVPSATDRFWAGEPVTVTGWGVVSRVGLLRGRRPDRLQEAKLSLMSLTACQALYWPSPARVLDTMLCARGEGGEDACTGDSGGPLVIRKGAWKHVLVGITSWGWGCGRISYPGIYTRVQSFLPWIEKRTRASPGIECLAPRLKCAEVNNLDCVFHPDCEPA